MEVGLKRSDDPPVRGVEICNTRPLMNWSLVTTSISRMAGSHNLPRSSDSLVNSVILLQHYLKPSRQPIVVGGVRETFHRDFFHCHSLSTSQWRNPLSIPLVTASAVTTEVRNQIPLRRSGPTHVGLTGAGNVLRKRVRLRWQPPGRNMFGGPTGKRSGVRRQAYFPASE